MRLIETKAELIQQENGLDCLYRHIEFCGRVAYKSEDRITPDSAKPFVDRMIASKHFAVLEHGTVYLILPCNIGGTKYKHNPYSKVYCDNTRKLFYVTTNMRVITENHWEKDLKYMSAPTDFHVKRYTFRVITSIGVTREINRHRVISIIESSTRFCNYTKDKFNNEVKFIRPAWLNLNKGVYEHVSNNKDLGDVVGDGYIKNINNRDEDNLFLLSCLFAEDTYQDLIDNYGWQPQQAREFLPLCTATEAVYTAFESDWKHFAGLRYLETTGKVHPNMKLLTELMKKECEEKHIMEDIWK